MGKFVGDFVGFSLVGDMVGAFDGAVVGACVIISQIISDSGTICIPLISSNFCLTVNVTIAVGLILDKYS